MFKKSKLSKDKKEKLEYQHYLAQANPQPIYDLSDIGLSEVPSDLFTICQALRKHELYLQQNELSSLSSGGDLRCLSLLTHLNLSENRFKTLPDQFGDALPALRVLNLSSNQLVALPNSLIRLTQLVQLNVDNNKLSRFPLNMHSLVQLRQLDMSQNAQFMHLPTYLCLAPRLTAINLTSAHMQQPPREICELGTEKIMQYLAQQLGLKDYEFSKGETDAACNEEGQNTPAFNHHSHQQSAAGEISESLRDLKSKEEQQMQYIKNYERMKESQRQETLRLQHELERHNQQQYLIAQSVSDKRDQEFQWLLEEKRAQDEQSERMIRQKQAENERFLRELLANSRTDQALIERLLDSRHEAKQKALELCRLENEKFARLNQLQIDQHEENQLRRVEIIKAMESMLAQNEALSRQVVERADGQRQHLLKLTEHEEAARNQMALNALTKRDNEQKCLRDQIRLEHDAQQQAFLQLQLKRDGCNRFLEQQISIIQHELQELTNKELKARERDQQAQIKTVLDEQRKSLVQVLRQLESDRMKRREDLERAIREMEENQERLHFDYWLIQYQRLLDSKPKSLELGRVYERDHPAKQRQLLPSPPPYTSAPHSHTHTLTDWNPIKKPHQTHHTADKQKETDQRAVSLAPPLAEASCPSLESSLSASYDAAASGIGPSAPPLSDSDEANVKKRDEEEVVSSVVTMRKENLCCVCIDNQTSILFLPCGHVCTCEKCATNEVTLCPLCRTQISQRVHLLQIDKF